MEKTRQLLALSKNLLIAVRRLSGDGLALSVSLRSPAPPKGEPTGVPGAYSVLQNSFR